MSIVAKVKRFYRDLNDDRIRKKTVPVQAPDPENTKHIVCDRKNVKTIGGSTIILCINTGNGFLFFRECPRHLPIREYVALYSDDFFDHVIATDAGAECKEHINASFRNDSNFDKFTNMGLMFSGVKSSPIKSFLETLDGDYIGIPTKGLDEEKTEIIKRFAIFSCSQLYSYSNNRYVGDGYQTYAANRGLATEEIARLLGVDDMIPHSEYCMLEINGERKRFGTIMEEAPGTLIREVPPERRRDMITPNLQRQLSDLNLLDIICNEIDHKPDNYNVIIGDDGKISGISAFDNDCPSTFYPYNDLRTSTSMKCSMVVSASGRINRPYLDKRFVEKMNALSKDEFSDALKIYLRPLQINSAWNRMQLLKKLISQSTPEEIELLDADEWNDRTAEKELGGKYGKTYLCSFVEDRYFPNGL